MITISNKESGDKMRNDIQFITHRKINFCRIDFSALIFSKFIAAASIIHILL